MLFLIKNPHAVVTEVASHNLEKKNPVIVSARSYFLTLYVHNTCMKNTFTLGLIVQVKTSAVDGHVRHVVVRTNGKELERPISRLILLPTD